jgi:hypothetical protein
MCCKIITLEVTLEVLHHSGSVCITLEVLLQQCSSPLPAAQPPNCIPLGAYAKSVQTTVYMSDIVL